MLSARKARTAAILSVLIVLVAVGSWSASSSIAAGVPPSDSRGTIVADGRTRTYALHVPPSYTGTLALPLVVALHGGGGTGAGMSGLTHLNAVADRHSFIVVYPDGILRRWADGRGTTPPEQSGVDDVGFLAALIERLSAELGIDGHRIYATGLSNGGFMSQRLACELSDKIAAVGVVAATVSTAVAARCQPRQPISVLLVHGTDDPLVPWNGGQVTFGAGGQILSVAATIGTWVSLNGCASPPAVRSDPIDPATGTRIRREVYGACKGRSEVILFAVEGGGHTWPGGVQYLPERIIGKTNRTLDASEALWEFFQRHPKP